MSPSPQTPPIWPRLWPFALAGGASGALVIPYLAAIRPELRELPVSLWVVAAGQGVQTTVLGALAMWAALALGPARGLWVRRGADPAVLPAVPWGRVLAAAVLAGALVLGVDTLLQPHLPPPKIDVIKPGPWLGMLAVPYGAIAEELLLRAGLLTVVAAVLSRFMPATPQRAARIAVGVAALLFAAGHVPAAAGVWDLNALVVGRVLVLNGGLGVFFGVLYKRYGLEPAMAAHGTIDVILHVLGPALAG